MIAVDCLHVWLSLALTQGRNCDPLKVKANDSLKPEERVDRRIDPVEIG